MSAFPRKSDLMIRKATPDDIGAIDALLYQVHKIHADLRPDLFRNGAKKYTDDELIGILQDETRPIFLKIEEGKVEGYAFCILTEVKNDLSLCDRKTLYIDDLCVDASCRGKGVGRALFRYVRDFASAAGCTNLTLNVWAGNEGARCFYEAMGMKTMKTEMEILL